VCPYWDQVDDKEDQEKGYCWFLEKGDYDDPSAFNLLWDQCKECGKNDDDESLCQLSFE